MSGFFNSENKFFVIMGKIFDMLVLSLLWFTFSLSGLMLVSYLLGSKAISSESSAFLVIFFVAIILTLMFGPASTALYYTTVKVIRRERSYLFKEFFRSFKLNFRQGVILSLIYGSFIALMVYNLQYSNQLSNDGSKYGSMMLGAFLMLGIFVLFTMIYAFPLLSRFTVTIKHLLKWSFFLAIRHIGWTLVMAALFVTTAILMYFSLDSAPPLMVVLPGVYTLSMSYPMEKVLKKYMPKEENTDEEDGVDRWYNE